MSEALCELGVIGLTTTGQSLAAHHASTKTRVCVCDDDANFIPQVINEYKTQTEAGEEGDNIDKSQRASRCMLPSTNMDELVARLSTPRKIIIFGTNEDDYKFEMYWNKLSPLLESGDMLLRWGKEEDSGNDDTNNSNIKFYNTSIVSNISKMHAKSKGIHLLEMVRLEKDRMVAFQGETSDVFLVGGPYVAYNKLERYISPCASVGHVGNEAGCAHYAHMIQRAIENGIMQTFGEGYDILRRASGFENQDIGRTFNKWNDAGGKLSSYLLRISSKICYKRDAITKKGFVVDHILDSVDLNSVDTWVTLEATKLNIPIPTLNAALETRFLSSMKDERVGASSILKAPEGADTPSVLKDQIAEDLQCAMYCACMCIVAESLAVFQSASDVESWDLNLKECIRLWNLPGSFLESTLMGNVHTSLMNDNSQETKSLLLVPDVASELQELHMSWRRIVTVSFASAIPCPTLSSALTHYDSFRSRSLSGISLMRAQRDFFNGSGYDRMGMEGWFTTNWTTEHTKEMKKKEAASGKKRKSAGP